MICVNCNTGKFIDRANCPNCGISIISTFDFVTKQNIKSWLISKRRAYNDEMTNQTIDALVSELDEQSVFIMDLPSLYPRQIVDAHPFSISDVAQQLIVSNEVASTYVYSKQGEKVSVKKIRLVFDDAFHDVTVTPIQQKDGSVAYNVSREEASWLNNTLKDMKLYE